MAAPRTRSHPRRRLAVLAIVGTCAALAGVLLGSNASSASPPTPIAPGPATARPEAGLGYRLADDSLVGYYQAGGAKIYCLSPGKRLPASVHLVERRDLGHLGAVGAHELAYALQRWGNARTAYQAAVESQVLNQIVGNDRDVRLRARQLPRSMNAVVRRHLALAQQFRGPYVVSVHAGRAVLPGQSGAGTVTVRSASGRLVPGVTVRLASSANAVVSARTSTGRSGTGTFGYRAIDVGEVHITAVAIGLPSTRFRANDPAPGEQRMVSWVHPTREHAALSFGRAPAGFANSYACTSVCDGRPRSTLRACAPASRVRSELVFHLGPQTRVLSFPSGRHRVCRALTTTLSDGWRISASWRFRTGHGWSRPVPAKGAFVVDCPPVPTVGATLSYDCTAATLHIGLAVRTADGSWAPLVNTESRRMVLVIGGAERRRIVAEPGHTAAFTAQVSCADPTEYTARAGVQRADGRYNYGPVVSVATPDVR